jgi:hypothetical protein
MVPGARHQPLKMMVPRNLDRFRLPEAIEHTVLGDSHSVGDVKRPKLSIHDELLNHGP